MGLKQKILEAVQVSTMDCDKLQPMPKDLDRAQGLEFRGSTFHGSGAPWQSEAEKMSKLIMDPEKLVRRAKAVVKTWGKTKYWSMSKGVEKEHDVWTPFKNALQKKGFSDTQIKQIESYK